MAAFTPWVFTGAVSGGGGFRATAAFVATGFGLVGFWEGFYPGYYGGYYPGYYEYGSCYLTAYGPRTVTDHDGPPGEHRSPASVPGVLAYCLDSGGSPGPAHDQRLISASVSKRTGCKASDSVGSARKCGGM